ncbi:MBL fold metallo-hydrolase [Bacillus sp. BP-3]|uniref:MBL fold metallo-hydrolase n=1 Tax=Bacillus sp. BP-3 TaxID=3022773 RepID=UPI00232BDE23|nr:MBL fold metallo-hydrolase [Bacillus sp. BP-3]MDC2864312.1 MBL fold metallo-hydrolase [Bacillus sp. BP-3]
MRVKVWGGAGEYGRSCYFIENKAETLLFDCGINRSCTDCYPKIEKEKVPFLQAVFISHIHEDHTMGLPLLAKYGYREKFGSLVIHYSSSRYISKNGKATIKKKEKTYHIINVI